MYICICVLIAIILINKSIASYITWPLETFPPKSHIGPRSQLEPDDYEDDSDFQMLITGGYRPIRHTFTKYMVSIRTARPTEYFGDNHLCAGVIIASTLILTAAHCVMDLNKVIKRPHRLLVVAGTPNRLRRERSTEEYNLITVIPHYKYRPKGPHDIALLRLEKPIANDNDNIKILPMAQKNFPIGSMCTVVGWGQLFKNGPYAADAVYLEQYIAKDTVCADFPNIESSSMICAHDKNNPESEVCRGDSGGPLICNTSLMGIIAWGAQCIPGDPSIFTSVTYNRRWIKQMSLARVLQPQPLLWVFMLIIGIYC